MPVIFGSIIALLGLVLIISPDTSLNIVCFVGGVAVILRALSKLSDYIRSARNGAPQTTDIITFAIMLSFAIVLMVHPKPLLSVFPVIVGICTLIYGIVSFFTKGKASLLGKIGSIITVIVALVVINAPMILAEAATAVSGIALVVIGVFMVASRFYAVKKLKDWNIEINTDDGYKEVDFTDVDE